MGAKFDPLLNALRTTDVSSASAGVSSISKSGSTQLTGDVTLSEGANVTLTQVGNDIEIASSGSGTSDHAALSHLAYADSGHTGFQPAGAYLTDIAGQDLSAADNTTSAFITASDIPAIPTSVDDLSPSQTGNTGKFLKTDGTNATWESIPGGGDMLASVYDPAGGAKQVAFSADLGTAAAAATTDFATAAQGSLADSALQSETDPVYSASEAASFVAGDAAKLAGIEAGADVTDATNVAAAGAIMDGDFSSNGLMKRTGAGTYGIATSTDYVNGFADPNADRIVFWDDSAGTYAALTASTGLTLSGTNLTVRASSETVTGIIERATDAETVTGTDTARATTPANITAKMAAPGAIGGTTPSTARFTTLTTTGNLELGHASDTTLSRVSAGVVAIEGNNIITSATVPTQYTDEMAQDAVGNAVGNGLDYDDASGVISVDETELTHNSLGSKQGGTTNEYYHLTSAQTSALHAAVTVTDSTEIDFTLTGQDITASIKPGSIDETKLDTSTNASLDLADSAVQPAALEDYTPREDILWFDRLSKAAGGFDLTVSGAVQGVAYDGTYYYVSTTTHLYKYNSAGTEQASHANSGDPNTHKYLGDLVYYNSKLYVASANFDAASSYTSFAVEFNASDLSYVGEHQYSTDDRGDAVTFHDGYFWMPMYNRTVRQYDTSWNYVAVHTLPMGAFEVDPGTYGYGFDGATWIGNNLILNPHEGVYPNSAYIFYFNGTQFMRSAQPARQIYCTQGLHYNVTTNQIICVERAATPRVSLLNIRTDAPSISEWKELGRTTLTAAGDTISVANLPSRKYLYLVVEATATGGTANVAVRFNNDSGNNYARARQTDFVTVTSGGSVSSIGITATAADVHFVNARVINMADQIKLMNVSSSQSVDTSAATAPNFIQLTGKWANTTDAINRVDVVNTAGTGDYAIGSELIVYGHN